jgi:SAM-dependent methyltransferase
LSERSQATSGAGPRAWARLAAGGPAGAAHLDFDHYTDSYRDAVERSIAFAGAEPERYTRGKARQLVDLAARRLGDPSNLEVLDVGCGPGETDAFLEGIFSALHGVDISAGMIEQAGRRNPWASYSSYGEGEALPREDEAFDLTFAISVLHHVRIDQRPGLVAEMARVTRPGGLVTIFEHNPWNPLTRKAVRGCPFDEDAVLLPRRRARQLLEGAGLGPAEAAYITFFPGEGPRLERAERALRWLPLGAQYYVAHRRERPADWSRP